MMMRQVQLTVTDIPVQRGEKQVKGITGSQKFCNRSGQIVRFSSTQFQRLGIILWVSRLCPPCYCFYSESSSFFLKSSKCLKLSSFSNLHAADSFSGLKVFHFRFSLILQSKLGVLPLKKKFSRTLRVFNRFHWVSLRQAKAIPKHCFESLAKACRVIHSVHRSYISFSEYCDVLTS